MKAKKQGKPKPSVPMKASPYFVNKLGQPLPPGALAASRKKAKASKGVIGEVKPKRKTRIPSAGISKKTMSEKRKPANTSVPARIKPGGQSPGTAKKWIEIKKKYPIYRGPYT